MGADDDTTCVEHVWAEQQVTLTTGGAGVEHTCCRCGALYYEASVADSGGDAGT